MSARYCMVCLDEADYDLCDLCTARLRMGRAVYEGIATQRQYREELQMVKRAETKGRAA